MNLRVNLGDFFKRKNKKKEEFSADNLEENEKNTYTDNITDDIREELDNNSDYNNSEYPEDVEGSNSAENIDTDNLDFFDVRKDIPPDIRKRLIKFFYGGLTKQNAMTFLSEEDLAKIRKITELIFNFKRAFSAFPLLKDVEWFYDRSNVMLFTLLSMKRSWKGFNMLRMSDFAVRQLFESKKEAKGFLKNFLDR